MTYKKIKNLVTSEIGEVFVAGRQVYPDNTGLFPNHTSGQYTPSEDIMELWDYKDSVVKGLDKQINHANLINYSGEKKLEKLLDWKVNHFKLPKKDTREKTFISDLSKVKTTDGKPDFTDCVQTTVQELSKIVQSPKNSVQKPQLSKESVQKGKWIVQNVHYNTAQEAANASNNTLKNIQRWCKNNKNNCSYSLK